MKISAEFFASASFDLTFLEVLSARYLGSDVRFGPKADKMLRCRECPLCATSGLMRRSKTEYLFGRLVGGKGLVTGLFRTRFIEPSDP
jgi:hypothetical protein